MMGGIGFARPAARALAGDRLQDTRARNALRSVSDYIAGAPVTCGNLGHGFRAVNFAGRWRPW